MGSYDEVVLKLALSAVVDQVNARVDASVAHLAVGWNMGTPVCRIISHEVVVVAGQLSNPGDLGVSIGSDNSHPHHGFVQRQNRSVVR